MINRYLDTPDIILPFYQEAAIRLKGKKSKSKKNGYHTYQVTCPKCNKTGSTYLYNISTTPLIFGLKCFKDTCRCNLTLNQYIRSYWSKSDRDRWLGAVDTLHNWKYQNQWLGIKKDSAKPSKPDKKSFREKMTLKSIRLMINVRAGKFHDPDSYYHTNIGAGAVQLP